MQRLTDTSGAVASAGCDCGYLHAWEILFSFDAQIQRTREQMGNESDEFACLMEPTGPKPVPPRKSCSLVIPLYLYGGRVLLFKS